MSVARQCGGKPCQPALPAADDRPSHYHDLAAPLELLVHRVERACAGLGFPVEGRPFRPHVTLGRVREGRRLPEPAVRAIEGAELPAASFMAERVVLYESLPGPGGSRYEERATFPLGTGD